jgi:hypothetical protein
VRAYRAHTHACMTMTASDDDDDGGGDDDKSL